MPSFCQWWLTLIMLFLQYVNLCYFWIMSLFLMCFVKTTIIYHNSLSYKTRGDFTTSTFLVLFSPVLWCDKNLTIFKLVMVLEKSQGRDLYHDALLKGPILHRGQESTKIFKMLFFPWGGQYNITLNQLNPIHQAIRPSKATIKATRTLFAFLSTISLETQKTHSLCSSSHFRSCPSGYPFS